MHKMTRRIPLALAILAAVLYAGCVGNNNPEDALVYYFFSTPTLIELHKEAVALFTEQNPDIKIKMVPCAFSQYTTKIKTAVAARRDIDVIWSSDAWTASFAASGLLMDLQPFVDREQIEDNYLQNILMNSRYPARPDGHIYALPNFWVTHLLFYNREMFDAEGLEYPNANWEWDDMLQAAKALTKDLDGDGKTDVFGMGPLGVTNLCDFIHSNGGQLFTEDFETCLLDQPRAVEAIQWVVDLVHKHHVVPGTQDLPGMAYPFAEERVAMIHQGSWNVLVYRDLDFRWDVAPIPMRNGKRFVYAGTNPWSIIKQTKRPEKAWRFVKFMASEEAGLIFRQNGGGPALKAQLDDPRYWDIEGVPEHYKEAMRTTAKYAKGMGFGAAHWMEWTEIWSTEFGEVLAGRRTVQESVPELTRDIERIIRRN